MAGTILNSEKAIICRDQKLLTIKCKYENELYYTLPGGQQEFGEKLTETVQRECMEEIGCEIVVKDLLCICERPQCGLGHMVDHYFTCELLPNSQPNIGKNPDYRQESIDWLPIYEIEKYKLHPMHIRKILVGIEERKNIYCGEGT